jgi:hypothetical protein
MSESHTAVQNFFLYANSLFFNSFYFLCWYISSVSMLLQHMYLILCILYFVNNIINYGHLSLIVHSNFVYQCLSLVQSNMFPGFSNNMKQVSLFLWIWYLFNVGCTTWLTTIFQGVWVEHCTVGLFYCSPGHNSTSWNAPVNIGFLCDKVAMPGEAIRKHSAVL